MHSGDQQNWRVLNKFNENVNDWLGQQVIPLSVLHTAVHKSDLATEKFHSFTIYFREKCHILLILEIKSIGNLQRQWLQALTFPRVVCWRGDFKSNSFARFWLCCQSEWRRKHLICKSNPPTLAESQHKNKAKQCSTRENTFRNPKLFLFSSNSLQFVTEIHTTLLQYFMEVRFTECCKTMSTASHLSLTLKRN